MRPSAPRRPTSAHRPFPPDPQPDGKLDIPDLDADLLEIFVQEASEILDEAEGGMASLRERPDDRELVPHACSATCIR